MDRKDFFKKCGKFIGGAVATVAVGQAVDTNSVDAAKLAEHSEKLKAVEPDIVNPTDVDIQFELPVNGINAKVEGNTITIYGVPENDSGFISLNLDDEKLRLITENRVDSLR